MTEKKKQLKEERRVKREIILLIILFLLGKKAKYVTEHEILVIIYAYSNQLPKCLKQAEVIRALSDWASTYLNKAREAKYNKAKLEKFLAKFAESEPMVRHFSDNNYVGADLVGKTETKVESTESTLFAEIERQIELDNKKKEFEEALKADTDLYVISTHAKSSLRCFPDQGKIVSKTLEAKGDDFKTGNKTKGGYEIYSLKAMLARIDAKGYHNFIICGFNCKHHLIPFFDKGQKPEIKQEEAENNPKLTKKRKCEYQLRKYSDAYTVYVKVDREKALIIKGKFDELFREYVDFCKENGFEVELWRCK